MRPEIRQLNVRLPRISEPVARWQRPSKRNEPTAIIEIFVAKWPGECWESPFLEELVGFCRDAYLKYHGMHLSLEETDSRALVFLARVITATPDGGEVHEWYSFRAAAGDDESIKKFTPNGVRNLEALLKKRGRLLDLSRFCGIPAYTVDGDGLALDYVTTECDQLAVEGLVLMTMEFINGYLDLAGDVFDWATFIMPEHLLAKMFVLDRNGDSIYMPMDPRRSEFSLNMMRVDLFKFAQYRFGALPLARALRDLRDEGQLTTEALEYYLIDADGRALESNVGRLLTLGGDTIGYRDKRGIARTCKINPQQLRIEIIKRVPLVAQLHIVPIREWRDGFVKMFQAIG